MREGIVAMLTEQERVHWDEQGYLHLRGVLSDEQVAFFNAEMDRLRGLPGYEPDKNPELPIGHYAWLEHAADEEIDGFMDRRDLLPYHQSFIDLIDASPVFDYIVDIMGVNIMLSMTQAIARPVTDKFPGYTHTDGGESMRMIRPAEGCPPIAMKAMYLLTDVDAEDEGNLTVFPGSHKEQIPIGESFLKDAAPVGPDSDGALHLMGKAGDVYLFPHSLWHGPNKNHGHSTRKVLLYNYCQLWVRSYDHDAIPEVIEACTPRQKRLLGDLGYDFRPGSYFYVPKDQAQVIQGSLG